MALSYAISPSITKRLRFAVTCLIVMLLLRSGSVARVFVSGCAGERKKRVE